MIEKLCATREGRKILRSQGRKKAQAEKGERVPWHPRIRELHAELEKRTPRDRKQNPMAKFKKDTIKDALEYAQKHDIEPYGDAMEIAVTTSTDTVVLDYDDGGAPDRLVLADLYEDLPFEFGVALAKAMKLKPRRSYGLFGVMYYKVGQVYLLDNEDGTVSIVEYSNPDRADPVDLWTGSPIDDKASYMKALARFAK